jgi:hypothetical protein
MPLVVVAALLRTVEGILHPLSQSHPYRADRRLSLGLALGGTAPLGTSPFTPTLPIASRHGLTVTLPLRIPTPTHTQPEWLSVTVARLACGPLTLLHAVTRLSHLMSDPVTSVCHRPALTHLTTTPLCTVMASGIVTPSMPTMMPPGSLLSSLRQAWSHNMHSCVSLSLSLCFHLATDTYMHIYITCIYRVRVNILWQGRRLLGNPYRSPPPPLHIT